MREETANWLAPMHVPRAAVTAPATSRFSREPYKVKPQEIDLPPRD